jgi:S1-C subfamily serine protease
MKLFIYGITLATSLFSAACFSAILGKIPVSLEFYKTHLAFEEVYYYSELNRDDLQVKTNQIFNGLGWEQISSQQVKGSQGVMRREPYNLMSDILRDRLPFLRARDLRGDKKVVKRWRRTQRFKDWGQVGAAYDKISASDSTSCTRYLGPKIPAMIESTSNAFKNSIRVCLSTKGQGSIVFITAKKYHYIDGRFQQPAGMVGVLWLPWLDGTSLADSVRTFNDLLSINVDKSIPDNKKEPSKSPQKISSGTGFFINNYMLMTNQHVVDECESISVKSHGLGTVLAEDRDNDLAIIQVGQPNLYHLNLADSPVRLGDDLVVLGYPLQGVLAESINMTKGNVSSLAGINGATNLFQMTAPIQPGNSGGPVINDSGKVAGIATSTLNHAFAMERLNTLPQSVNFAIRHTVVRNFLQVYGVKIGDGSDGIADYTNMAEAVKSIKCSSY